jgi:RNA polymerase sigma-70 factor (ECF subfamily)
MASETELLRRLAGGDESALEELLDEHLPGLRGFVRLHVGAELRAREETTDLVQSVCREILLHRERFRYPGENGFKRWLYATALRKIRNRADYWRAEKRAGEHEVHLDASDGEGQLLACYRAFRTPSAEIAGREEIARIEATFDRLSSDHREVITLSKIAGLPRAEVAAQMGRSEDAVSMLLYRALGRLAELLDAP